MYRTVRLLMIVPVIMLAAVLIAGQMIFGVPVLISGGITAAGLAVVVLISWLTALISDQLEPKIPILPIDDHLVQISGPPWRRVETDLVDLAEVGWVGWDVDLFEPSAGTLSLTFYDQHPDLELTVFGFIPRNRDALRLADVDSTALAMSTAARSYLARYVQERGIDTNVDLDTLEPIAELRPPLAENTTYDGHLLIRHPNSARNED